MKRRGRWGNECNNNNKEKKMQTRMQKRSIVIWSGHCLCSIELFLRESYGAEGEESVTDKDAVNET